MDLNNRISVAVRMTDAWNARDVDTYLSFLTEDAVWDDPSMPEPSRGREAIRETFRVVLRAFPDFLYTIREPICVSPDGSRCAVQWRIQATFLGPYDPPRYAPTGLKTDFKGIDWLEFRGDQVCSITTYVNLMVPTGQMLGLEMQTPAPGSWQEKLGVLSERMLAAWLRFRTHHS